MSNDTELALLAALENLTPIPEPVYEYRAYYDPITKDCIYKTIYDDKGDYVVISKDEYEAMIFCPHYYVRNGKVVKRPVDFTNSVKLELSSEGFKALRGCNIFVTDSDDCDYWDIK